MDILRKIFFWNYARNTWQWDLLCVVILVFIFGTPKSWFENSERGGRGLHQNPAATKVMVAAELVDNAEDKGRLEQVVRDLTSRQDVQVLGVKKVVDKQGKTRGYEVDIR